MIIGTIWLLGHDLRFIRLRPALSRSCNSDIDRSALRSRVHLSPRSSDESSYTNGRDHVVMLDLGSQSE